MFFPKQLLLTIVDTNMVVLNYCIALIFHRRHDSGAAGTTVKFQSDQAILNTKIEASRLRNVLR